MPSFKQARQTIDAMCPFKKAFPLVLFLHLVFVIGIFTSFGQPKQTFTLIPPAQGQGSVLQVGLARPAAPAQDSRSSPAPRLLPSRQPVVAPPPERMSKVFPSARPALQTVNAGSVAADVPSALARAGADIPSDTSLGGSLTPPIALKKPKPVHPSGGGEVVIEFTINTRGYVENARVQAAPNAQLAAAVMAILPQWRFVPARQDGAVISLRVRQVVKF